ncbi:MULTISPECIES: hypothetical protein [unclassified Synechococcus]|uniref:hypothetical protein n=1 Tax=unclassified Synechococcus TaxID=2626047 RepID=UPI0021A70BF9|nr:MULTISPECIES: hypothetical protein [unclassified Synechococcus]MCT0214679.1 hypothetical protein [Synechococcus sp. CS-1326]MCT0234013.1 hypothetical protein [Synechococcus sp. CS-1327]
MASGAWLDQLKHLGTECVGTPFTIECLENASSGSGQVTEGSGRSCFSLVKTEFREQNSTLIPIKWISFGRRILGLKLK